ncbi:glycine cleavage H-protein-domain-containing protein [Paraphysoderma sedebokerense]|nr:glycine cleavage H-protein-domain-containing protein [Paraphysoderma sedebokerense]
MSLRLLSSRITASWPPSLASRSFVGLTVRGYASGRRYTPDHEWVEVNDGVGTVGISDYAANALGEVVYAEVPELNKEIARKDVIAAVESVKAASDIYSPVSGKIVEVNTSVADEPIKISDSPMEEGWLCKVKLSDVSELDSLMDEDAYRKHCG